MSHSQVFTFFFAALATTVVVLVATMACGYKRWIRAHLVGVGVFLLVFLATVAGAEMLGRHYEFSQPSIGIHLTLAIGTSIGTLAPLVTGVLRYRKQGSLRSHRIAVYSWLCGIVATLSTGIWMLAVAERTAKSLAGE